MNAPPVGLAFLISQVGAHAAHGFAELLSQLDLKPHDAGILRILGSNPGQSQQALSDLLGAFPSQLVAMVDGLEKRGLVERRNNPHDRRSYRLYLTKTGRKTLARIGKLTLQLESDLFAALHEQDRAVLLGLLTRIISEQGLTPGVHPAYKQIGMQ